jgi:S1-C subfamily serine protease
MKRCRTVLCVLLGAAVVASAETNAPRDAVGGIVELNTTLMRATYRFEAPGSLGTIFVIGVPTPDSPASLRYALVTAAHVLEHAQGEKATLHVRVKTEGRIQRLPVPIQIRDGDNPRWVRHPKADVAAMLITVPSNIDIDLLTPSLFADDAFYDWARIHPGDELFALGFPLGAEANDLGYPILRTGAIASYPLVPTRTNETFLLDLEIRPGNSGGPVCLYQLNRMVEKDTTKTINTCRIMGLISQEKVFTEQMKGLYEARTEQHPINVAQVVHATLIVDTVGMLAQTLRKSTQHPPAN